METFVRYIGVNTPIAIGILTLKGMRLLILPSIRNRFCTIILYTEGATLEAKYIPPLSAAPTVLREEYDDHPAVQANVAQSCKVCHRGMERVSY
mmetsp:Transcript_43729/g.105466  ORF Transcript_43729/g.105466 Transcript_43729/m.105466 type:complete len:94 (-) Transcript_43729:1009-1290(-)